MAYLEPGGASITTGTQGGSREVGLYLGTPKPQWRSSKLLRTKSAGYKFVAIAPITKRHCKPEGETPLKRFRKQLGYHLQNERRLPLQNAPKLRPQHLVVTKLAACSENAATNFAASAPTWSIWLIRSGTLILS